MNSKYMRWTSRKDSRSRLSSSGLKERKLSADSPGPPERISGS